MHANSGCLWFLPRFSLRTLLLAVLLFASFSSMSARWAPWVVDHPGPQPGEFLNVLAIAPDGRTAVAQRYENRGDSREAAMLVVMPDLYLVNLEGQAAPRMLASSNGKERQRLAFSRDGRWVVGSDCGELIVWRAATGAVEHRKEIYVEDIGYDHYFYDTCRYAEFLPDGQAVIAAGDQSLYCYDLRTENLIRHPIPLHDNQGLVEAFALSPDGSRGFYFHGFPPMLFDTRDLAAPGDIPSLQRVEQKFLPSRGARFSDDGAWVIGVDNNNFMKTCDARSQPLLATVAYGVKHIDDVALSPDRTRLFANLGRMGVVLQDLEDKTDRARFGRSDRWAFVRFSDENRTIEVIDVHGWKTRCTRRRPEPLWGIAWLPEAWLALGFALSLLWSIGRDRKTIRAKDAAAAQASSR